MLAAPWLRALVLRLFGLLAVILAVLGALGLLVYGFAGSPSWVTDAAAAFADWVSAPLTSWVAMLVGIGLLVAAGVVALIMVPRRLNSLWLIQQSPAGKTLLDVPSVAQALQAELQLSVDPHIVVKVRRRRLRVVTPFAASRPFELVDTAGQHVRAYLVRLGLDSHIRYEVTTGRETKRRVQ